MTMNILAWFSFYPWWKLPVQEEIYPICIKHMIEINVGLAIKTI